ncbi:hypothetical protein COV19_01775 [Candidatus Woesearchaeota archaeon CG10_big_fil_rev_8_21_14_0_10_44_13]|nr:MAG: hypothetical protein COV19_01775 [Candidatus Woesearchaeota archaeon CG10_big_fil_rev_8_21_14_0_10_44_13]
MYGASFVTDKNQAPYRMLHEGLFAEGPEIEEAPRSSRQILRPKLMPVAAAYLAIPDRENYGPETQARLLWLQEHGQSCHPSPKDKITLGEIVYNLIETGSLILATKNNGPRTCYLRRVPEAGEEFTDTMIFYRARGELKMPRTERECSWVSKVRGCWKG